MDLQNNTIPFISITERTHIQPGLYTADVLHVITLTSWSSYCLGSPALNPAAVVPTNHLYWDEEGKIRFYSRTQSKQLVVPGCSEHWNELKTILYHVEFPHTVHGENEIKQLQSGPWPPSSGQKWEFLDSTNEPVFVSCKNFLYLTFSYCPVVPGCMSIFHGIKQKSYIYFLLQNMIL